MANAQVEKLKDLGLRHGEKAVVGLATALCLLFLVFAATKPSIDLTPDQVNKDAEAARSGLERRQEPADILTALEQQQIKNPGYVAQVESQEKNALSPADFKVARSWVTPEPGAGLIRDTPELIAPSDLFAYPGRGGALVFALDPETKKRIPEDPNEKKADSEADKLRRSRKRPRGPSMSAMAGSMPGQMPTNPADMTDEQKKQLALEKKKREALLAGSAGPEEAKKAEAAPAAEGPFKEVTRGIRWVGITGVIDHKKLRDNYLNALKNPAIANPNYKQLGVERQVKQSDGSWSDWEPVDTEKNREIVYNLPEEEEELTPETVRIASLVDPLPFLKAGYWERVHVASLVPKEKREIDAAAVAAASSGDMSMPGMMPGMAPPQMNMSMGMGMGMGMGETSMAGPENTNFPTTEAPTIMIRSLDFTVAPDTTYRFRLRIEVFNPNYNREDVSPGTDTKSLVLQGPWSEPTNEVTMPADVTAYAMRKVPSAPNAKRNDKVQYQIVCWNPEDGVTVKRNVEYGPGQIVGEVLSTRVPVSDGSGVKNKPINFNSHQLMLDETGGDQSHSHLGVGGQIDVPVVSLLLRPDGSVVVRNEVYDLNDPVRKDISENYDREIEESTKRRENSNGSMGVP